MKQKELIINTNWLQNLKFVDGSNRFATAILLSHVLQKLDEDDMAMLNLEDIYNSLKINKEMASVCLNLLRRNNVLEIQAKNDVAYMVHMKQEHFYKLCK